MRIEIANTIVAIVVLCEVRHKYDVRVTLQLIEIYFRTLRHARAGNTCCCRSHLPSVKNRQHTCGSYIRKW